MPRGRSPPNCIEHRLAGSSLMHSGEIPAPGELFRHAFRRLKTEQDHLFRIAVIPTLLYFLIFVFLRPLEQDLPALLLPLALILIPETLFDVAWLRWILGAGADDPPLPFRWTLRHTGYCGRRLAVRFFLMAAVVPVIVISALFPENLRPVFLSACLPLLFYLSLRFSLFVVARAIDGTCDFRRSWEATREGIWRFFWGAAFAAMPLLILLAVIGELVNAAGFATTLPLAMILLAAVANFALRALLLAVTAEVYDVKMMNRVIH
jgi:hypothetical protein